MSEQIPAHDDGEPDPAPLRPQNMSEHPEKVSKRIQNADQMDAEVYPVAQGMYRVVSDEEEYIVNIDAKEAGEYKSAPCLCSDFLYRAAQLNIDCKHALFVKRRISEGYLPPVKADPVPWMESELRQLHDRVMRMKQETVRPSMMVRCDAVLTNLEAWLENPLGANLYVVKTYIESELQPEISESEYTVV